MASFILFIAGSEEEEEDEEEAAALEREVEATRAQDKAAITDRADCAAKERAKGAAVRNQKALWERALEMRILLQRCLQVSFDHAVRGSLNIDVHPQVSGMQYEEGTYHCLWSRPQSWTESACCAWTLQYKGFLATFQANEDPLQAANRLAQPHMHAAACSIRPELRSGYCGLADASAATIDQLLDLHDALLERTPAAQLDNEDAGNKGAGHKRKSSAHSDDSIAGGAHSSYLSIQCTPVVALSLSK